MKKYRVTTPADGYSGEVAGVHFVKGSAVVEAPPPLERLPEGKQLNREERAERERVGQDRMYRAMAYFRAQGYGVEEIDDEKPATDPEDTEPKSPNRGDSKATWKAYAIKQGMPEAEAEAMTRDQLAEHYLGPKEA